MRKDIPEGSDEADLPRFIGWGRILTAEWITERYFTLRVLAWRLFIVRCHSRYPRNQEHRYFRGWLQGPGIMKLWVTRG